MPPCKPPRTAITPRKATAAAAAPRVANFFSAGFVGAASAGGPQELDTPHEIELRFRAGGMMVVLAADRLSGGGSEPLVSSGAGSEGSRSATAGGMGDAGIGVAGIGVVGIGVRRSVCRGGGGVTSRDRDCSGGGALAARNGARGSGVSVTPRRDSAIGAAEMVVRVESLNSSGRGSTAS